MKYLVIFLVLSLVVFMAEPGEGFFRHLKAIFKGARQGWRDYRQQRKSQRVQQDDDSQPPDDERW
nr:antimicrobial peptide 2-like protein [Platichthys stellatus]